MHLEIEDYAPPRAGFRPSDHAVEVADVIQAYPQALFTGTETWILLPEAAWEPEWHGLDRPVVLLERNIYGHPDAGTI